MYVRDAKNRDEVWLLDHIEAMGLDEGSFRSRDYVIAVDEETNERAGFGRIRIHKPGGSDGDDGDDEFCELTSIGVAEPWRGQGVGAHVVERLVDEAGDDGFDAVYSFTSLPAYLAQFGFERVDAADLPDPVRERFDAVRADDDAVALRLATAAFEMPPRLRERFKTASPADGGDAGATVEETAEDFGIDPEETTYKYDTGQ